jgi:5'-deoxynucleotidase YfbR-like HD superfamily hydrolase
MNIREILRAAHVQRWHMVRTLRQQNNAEHHYLVTMIARDMAARIGMTDVASVMLLTDWCLRHDTPESLTGDIPTLTKLEIKKHVDFNIIEDSVSLDYARLRRVVEGTPVATVAKLADLMEGILFLEFEGVRVEDPSTYTYRALSECVVAYRRNVKAAITANSEYAWHLLYDYREELNESPVRFLRDIVPANRSETKADGELG